ncbi:MAG: DUF2798 domain-containing protein [Agitococcus sp.]|nr:DUF2798 domain-containing protein [Agitococcus sp.]
MIRWKLPARYTAQVFAFYMATIMALLMSAAIVATNTGIGAGFLNLVFHAYQLAIPAAFFCILFRTPNSDEVGRYNDAKIELLHYDTNCGAPRSNDLDVST